MGKVKKGVLREGMFTNINGHEAKVVKIEKEGGRANKAEAGTKANIWVEGSFTKEELEAAINSGTDSSN